MLLTSIVRVKILDESPSQGYRCLTQIKNFERVNWSRKNRRPQKMHCLRSGSFGGGNLVGWRLKSVRFLHVLLVRSLIRFWGAKKTTKWLSNKTGTRYFHRVEKNQETLTFVDNNSTFETADRNKKKWWEVLLQGLYGIGCRRLRGLELRNYYG